MVFDREICSASEISFGCELCCACEMEKERRMSDRNEQSEKIPDELTKASSFRIAPVTALGSFEDYVEDMEALCAGCEEEFLAADVRSDDFPKTCEKWAAASRALIMAAGALFGKYPADQNNKARALEMFGRCVEGSGIRAKNLKLHYILVQQNEETASEKLDQKYRQMLEGYKFFFRAENTRLLYLRRYVTDPDYVSPEYRMEYEQGPIAKVYRSMVPEGHIFMPARPYPPVRTPDWQNGVPYPPEPFCRWKNLPPEDFIYDAEHDEFVLPEGYLSEDGTIDDKSVVFDWENRTVTMKFVDGEPVTWPFWKPKDVREAPQRGTWYWDYYQVLYRQVIGGP